MLPITVIVPYYAGLAFLPGLRISLLEQGAAEVVVVVDGGGEFDEVSTELADVPGLRVEKTKKALGTAGARNYGASFAGQPWLTFLDQDDEWPAGFLSELYSHVGDDVLAYDSDLFGVADSGDTVPLGMTMFERQGWTKKHLSIESSDQLTAGYPMVKLLLPSTEFRKVGGFRTSIYAVEDFDLVWRLVAKGNSIRVVDSPRGRYLVRADSITGRIAAGDFASSMRAQRSWLDIWSRIAASSVLPTPVRLAAMKNNAKVLRRIAGLVAKRLLDLGPSSSSRVAA